VTLFPTKDVSGSLSVFLLFGLRLGLVSPLGPRGCLVKMMAQTVSLLFYIAPSSMGMGLLIFCLDFIVQKQEAQQPHVDLFRKVYQVKSNIDL